MLSEALCRRIERLGPRIAPQQVLAITQPTAAQATVESFLQKQIVWRAWKKAPGIYELTLLPKDIEKLSRRPDLFRRLDLAGRLYGSTVHNPSQTVRIRLWVREGAQPEALLQSMHATVTGQGDGNLEVTLPPAALSDLACADEIEGFEVL